MRPSIAAHGSDRDADFETFEHESDVGIRGFGATEEQAFANAAVAMYSVMVDVELVEPKESRTVKVAAEDREQLLIEWLNALLAISDIDRLVFSRFEAQFAGNTLTGKAWGERLDRERHDAKVEVKGATYHLLRTVREGGRYIAQCVVDV
jgi:SHS2 domain-containing protein